MAVSELTEILGRNIREVRRELGISQQKLAELAGLSVSHVSDLELGRKWVSAESLVRIADTLMVPPWVLLFDGTHSGRSNAEDRIRNADSLRQFAGRLQDTLNDVVAETLRELLQREDESDET